MNTINTRLNAICPYFTMFPLDFPYRILRQRAQEGDTVLDPFCGRGTTNYAARILGLHSLGIDASPIAAAITASKLVSPSPSEILTTTHEILSQKRIPNIPIGEFWHWAYHEDVLHQLCVYREALLRDCTTDARIALRGIILGALHGPIQKLFPSYFSNQAPRTFAPKPAYAVRYWKQKNLKPQYIDLLNVIERRAFRYYSKSEDMAGKIQLGDSREIATFEPNLNDNNFKWIITSPPYYGMRTYIPDQWIRNWFLGGPDNVEYTNKNQVIHSSPEKFMLDLRKVWRNTAKVSRSDARMVIRFGGISDKSVNPLDIIKTSLSDSFWRIATIKPAGIASHGKRQADIFLKKSSKPVEEYDIWAYKLPIQIK